MKSAIAHRKSKIYRTHLQRTHSSQTLSARTSARTSHVRKCDNTHMCAATQHLETSNSLKQPWFKAFKGQDHDKETKQIHGLGFLTDEVLSPRTYIIWKFEIL